MQKVKLPQQLDPVKSANKRSDYSGVFNREDLNRLDKAVESIDSDVAIDLRFEKDKQGLVIMRGTLATSVSLACQRCNQAFAKKLSSEFIYSPVSTQQQRDNLPEAYEGLELDENSEFNLLQVIEDEILLAIPIVPMHDQKDCSVVTESLSWGEIKEAEEKPNPFAVLKDLKKS